MTTALEFFRQMAAEFDNMQDAEVETWISTAKLTANVCSDGDAAELACALYAAHLLWIKKHHSDEGKQRGAVVSETDNKQSRNYQPIQGSESWLGQSPYGLQYMNMNPVGTGLLTRF